MTMASALPKEMPDLTVLRMTAVVFCSDIGTSWKNKMGLSYHRAEEKGSAAVSAGEEEGIHGDMELPGQMES